MFFGSSTPPKNFPKLFRHPFVFAFGSKARAQASIEYLIILAAFFAVLGVVLPVIFASTEGFLASSDVALAKRIASEVGEKVSLLGFLADGSQFTLSYFPSKEITVFSRGNEVVFSSAEKEFGVSFPAPQVVDKESFGKKFTVSLKKSSGGIQLSIQGS